MDFGKLSDISRVDFRLPADDPRNQEVRSSSFDVYTGAPVWAKREWVGKVFPVGTSSRDYLREYALRFNAIELNSTHYQIPSQERIDEWKSKTPSGFKFCPKFPQSISHSHDLRAMKTETEAFVDSVRGFGEKLGTTFLQLPPTFAPGRRRELEGWLDSVMGRLPVEIEFRNPDWFESGRLAQDAFELLADRNVGAVITDVAGRRDVSHSSLTGNRLLVRFVGNLLHVTDYSRIDAWIHRLNRWKNQGLRELYFFVHQTDDVLAPELISEFQTLANLRLGTRLNVWAPVESPGQLKLL